MKRKNDDTCNYNFEEEENHFLLGFTVKVKQISEHIAQTSKLVYKGIGLDLEQNWHLILLLLEQQPLSVVDISRHLGFSHPAIIKMLNKMEAKELIFRDLDPKDHRKQLIYLTDLSLEKMPEFKKKWNAIAKILAQHISEKLVSDLTILENKLKTNEITELVLKEISENRF